MSRGTSNVHHDFEPTKLTLTMDPDKLGGSINRDDNSREVTKTQGNEARSQDCTWHGSESVIISPEYVHAYFIRSNGLSNRKVGARSKLVVVAVQKRELP